MILDASGKPMPGETPETKQRQVEIVKSFSYKLSLKNPDGSPTYESCDFFCSKKDHCDEGDEMEMARELAEFCVDQVLEDIKLFQERRARRQAERARKSA